MSRKSNVLVVPSATYHEESVIIPFTVSALVLALVCAPLLWAITKINHEGTKSSDVSKFKSLADAAYVSVKTVDALFHNDEAELAAIRASQQEQEELITITIPYIQIEEEAPPVEKHPLDVGLINIYWDVNHPLVGIGGETYGLGDKVQGYEITRITKSRVYFKSSDGKTLVKDVDEDLLKNIQ